MAPQTITEKPPNLTVGCGCCKANSWDGSHQTPDSTTVRKLYKPGLIREDNSILNSRGLLIICDSNCFLNSMLKGGAKWFFIAALLRYPRAWSGQQFLASSQSFCPHLLQLFHRFLDNMESPLSWLWTTWAWWSAFLAFTLELYQHSVHCGERNLEDLCYLPLT